MRLDLTPDRLPLTPGDAAELTLTITNTGDVIDGYAVRVLGLDPAWVSIADAQPRLFPGETTTVAITVRAPDELPAGTRRIGVQVRELAGRRRCEVRDAVLAVAGRRALTVRLDPRIVTAGRRATYSAVIENGGNTAVDGHLAGCDPESRLRFTCKPDGFSLAPGGQVVLTLRAAGRRRLTGSPTPRQFDVRLGDGPAPPPAPRPRRRRRLPHLRRARQDKPAAPQTPPAADPPDAVGVFVQRPVLGRGALALVGLVAAVTVFATVITLAMAGLASRSAADRDLALAVAQARDADSRTGTSSLAGQVRVLTSGAEAKNVSVEVFGDDLAAAVASTATDDKGAFKVTALPAGSYKLRVRGAGFTDTWYPAAPTAADATAVDLGEGRDITGLTVLVGGVPARIAGTVLPPETPASVMDGDRGARVDLTGVVVQLQLPLDVPPLVDTVRPEPGEAPAPVSTGGPAAGAQGTQDGRSAQGALGGTSGAVVRTVTLAADGIFDLTDVPSPAVYDLVVDRPGAGAQVTRLDVAAGESRVGLRIQLLRGTGVIAGTVRDSRRPIAGATVTATSGTSVVRTMSAATPGTSQAGFALRELPTPATYTLTVAAPGLAPTTLALSLAAGQQLTGVEVVLGSAGARLGGTVQARGVPDAEGVTVTATDGVITVRTLSHTPAAKAAVRRERRRPATTPAAAWALAGLPVPGTYTLSFTRDDLQTEVRSISLDAAGNLVEGSSDTDVVMNRATATLVGITCTRESTGTTTTTTTSTGRPPDTPVGGVSVTVTSADGDWTATSSTGRVSAGSLPALTAPQGSPCGGALGGVGTYAIAGLPADTYTVTFTRPGVDPTLLQITLAPGQDRRLDAALDNTASISGTIVRAGSPTPPLTCVPESAPPVESTTMIAELWAAADYPRAGDAIDTKVVDACAAYRFANVPAGRYLVAVRESIGGGIVATSRVIDLESGDTATVALTVPAGAGS